MKDLRTQVLTLKLRGYSPRDIADTLDISIQTVMKEDKAIMKLMKNGDEDDIASMSPEELKLATATVRTILPYMEKNLDAIQRSNKSLQTVHKTALDVAESTMNIIQARMKAEDIKTAELGQLVDMFATVYNALYNKNGIQIINMLANASQDPEADKLERHKAMMKEEIDKRKELAHVIDVELEE